MVQEYRRIISEISNQIVNRHKKTKNVLGVFLIGSASRGTFDKYSDIDFFVILAKKDKYRREKFSTKYDFDVEILFNTVTEIKQYFKAERKSIYRNTSHMLGNGKIIYYTSPVIKQIQNIARKNLEEKTEYSKDEVIMHKYSLSDFLGDARRDAARNDLVAFYLDSNFFIQNSIELLLKLSGNFYRKPKEMPALLRRIDRRFALLLKNFYKARLLQDKLKILAQISDSVAKKSGGRLSSNWALQSKKE